MIAFFFGVGLACFGSAAFGSTGLGSTGLGSACETVSLIGSGSTGSVMVFVELEKACS